MSIARHREQKLEKLDPGYRRDKELKAAIAASTQKRACNLGSRTPAAAWASQHNLPIYLGEFGAYEKADDASRVRWTTYIREQAEARGFAWAYWEFGAGFGLYDRNTRQWREALLQALIP